MNPLIDELHDIEGIDPISWWPLAIGWWGLILVAGIACAALFFYWYFRRRYLWSWKYDALKELNMLERDLTERNTRETAVVVSELMRRIAVKRYSRQKCAGLVGSDWLRWLAEHDPKKFNWEEKGKILVDIPYAPEDHCLEPVDVLELLEAAKGWVR